MRDGRIGAQTMTSPLRQDPGPHRSESTCLETLWHGTGQRPPARAEPDPARSDAMPWEMDAAPIPLVFRHKSSARPDRDGTADPAGFFFSRGKHVEDEPIERVLLHMAENFDLPLTVAELASIAGFAIYDFCLRFHRVIGRTPYAHLLELRLAEAKSVLLETDLDLGSIALLCGFDSRDDFWSCFESRVGRAPGEWRRTRR